MYCCNLCIISFKSKLNKKCVSVADPVNPNTEPMTLGSPVSSPKSKATSSQNYLPPYLFGEVSTSPVGAATWSTPKQHNTSFPSTPSQHSSLSHYRDQQISFQSPASRSLINTPTAGKSGGPPVQGLLYTSTTPASSFHITQFDTTPKTPGRPNTETVNNDSILTPSKSFCLNSNSHMSPAQIDPFFTQGENLQNSDQLDESWVTVFGFPSASASFILQQFSQYGNIIEHKIHPTGNWMHIRYQSKLQAKK
ncbi:Nucleoporin NUP53, partial [Stegodyphus mimosarum]